MLKSIRNPIFEFGYGSAALGFAASVFAGACFTVGAHAQDSTAPRRAAIRPSIVRLDAGESCPFRVVLAPGWLHAAEVAKDVEWFVNDVPGGNSRIGTIDAKGVYRAPDTAPQPREVHVCAKVEAAANPRLWATVIVGDAETVYEMTSSWKEPADGSVHLKAPSDLALDPDGNLIITDAGCSQVFRYSPKGEFLGTIGQGAGRNRGQFDGPCGVTVDTDGNVFVSDIRTGPPRIQAFNAKGELLYGFAQKGVGPGQVMQTRGMDFDPSGRLLVADADNARINVYAHDGAFLEAWERSGVRPGEFNEPYGVVIDKNGDVFVPNYYGPCQKFTGKGEFLFAFAPPDPPDGPVAYTSAAGDRWGNVFLVVRDTAGLLLNSVEPEPKPVRILKFNNNGDLIANFLLWNDEEGENSAAVDDQDRLHVLFKRNGTTGVAIFEPR